MTQGSPFEIVGVGGVTCTFPNPCRERKNKGKGCNCSTMGAPLQGGGFVCRFTSDSCKLFRKCQREDKEVWPSSSLPEDR